MIKYEKNGLKLEFNTVEELKEFLGTNTKNEIVANPVIIEKFRRNFSIREKLFKDIVDGVKTGKFRNPTHAYRELTGMTTGSQTSNLPKELGFNGGWKECFEKFGIKTKYKSNRKNVNFDRNKLKIIFDKIKSHEYMNIKDASEKENLSYGFLLRNSMRFGGVQKCGFRKVKKYKTVKKRRNISEKQKERLRFTRERAYEICSIKVRGGLTPEQKDSLSKAFKQANKEWDDLHPKTEKTIKISDVKQTTKDRRKILFEKVISLCKSNPTLGYEEAMKRIREMESHNYSRPSFPHMGFNDSDMEKILNLAKSCVYNNVAITFDAVNSLIAQSLNVDEWNKFLVDFMVESHKIAKYLSVNNKFIIDNDMIVYR